jgi:hypothetical protein
MAGVDAVLRTNGLTDPQRVALLQSEAASKLRDYVDVLERVEVVRLRRERRPNGADRGRREPASGVSSCSRPRAEHNRRESAQLSRIRDELFPKRISGEFRVRVPEAERAVEAAA